MRRYLAIFIFGNIYEYTSKKIFGFFTIVYTCKDRICFYSKNELGARKTIVFIEPDAADNSKTIVFKAPERADNSKTIIFYSTTHSGLTWGSRGFEHAMCGVVLGTAGKATTHRPAKARYINQHLISSQLGPL